jgi:hypothetical protein
LSRYGNRIYLKIHVFQMVTTTTSVTDRVINGLLESWIRNYDFRTRNSGLWTRIQIQVLKKLHYYFEKKKNFLVEG